MGKGKGKAKKVEGDWDWVGTEVKREEDITDAHRRRAAGLHRYAPCPWKLAEEGTGNQSEGSVVCTEDKSGCKEAKCKRNIRCYNHLGAEELVKEDGEERFVTEKLGDPPTKREGKAGLRNLGATCYANAFLQLWFHNIAFRNGVYQCLAQESSAMHHLAVVFASLQYSDRGYVDTSGLVKALRLDTGNQQDAAEFSKLFMDLIANEFSRQADPKVKQLVNDLFQGDMEYITNCLACGYESRSTSTFLELELSLKDGHTLTQRIAELMREETLEGDNMYKCPRCDKLRIAKRRVQPSRVPRVLHFSLNRFVYDPKLGDRKKIKASITYPKSMTVAGKPYDLCGVITHQGTTAHSGHFICDVLDDTDGEWYTCNDEEVTKKSDRPNKKPRLSMNGDGKLGKENGVSEGNEKSKDAYMLVYRQQGETAAVPPRQEIMKKVKADNDGLRIQFEEIDAKKADARKLFQELKAVKMEVIKCLLGIARIVPRHSLASWIGSTSQEDLRRPFDMDTITCEHRSVDPDKIPEARLISQAAFDQLADLTKLPSLEICHTCVADRFNQMMNRTDRVQQIESFEALNESGEREWLVSTEWLKQWKKGKLPSGALPTDKPYSILCPHGIPKEGPANLITRDGLLVLRSAVGDFESWKIPTKRCVECESDLEEQDLAEAEWKSMLQATKAIKKDLNKGDQIFAVDYYAIPPAVGDRLFNWWTNIGPLPEIKIELCEHGGIDFDPMMEFPNYMTADGWEAFQEYFGPQTPIVIQFGANSLEGKRTQVNIVSQRVCDECRSKRLRDWVQTNVYITLTDENDSNDITPIPAPLEPQRTGGSMRSVNGDRKSALAQLSERRRSSRITSSNTVTIPVDKSTTVKDLKLAIMNGRRISPISQRISYHNRVLESDETMESIGLLMDDTLHCLVLEEKDEKGTGVEGFGGTALVGGIACPKCTYINPGGSESCTLCETAFDVGGALE